MKRWPGAALAGANDPRRCRWLELHHWQWVAGGVGPAGRHHCGQEQLQLRLLWLQVVQARLWWVLWGWCWWVGLRDAAHCAGPWQR